ncbi:hypothetical protein FB451DRAFT_1365689, partial [Mycena latifolia]
MHRQIKRLEVHVSAVQTELEVQKKKTSEARARCHNTRRREDRARTPNAVLRDRLDSTEDQIAVLATRNSTLTKKVKALGIRARRAVVEKVKQAASVFKLQKKGVISESLCELPQCARIKGPRCHHDIKSVAESVGVTVAGSISERSIDHIVHEGGLIAQAQVIHKVQRAPDVRMSGDGTSLHNIQQNSKFLHYSATLYGTDVPKHINRFLGITTADVNADMHEAYNSTVGVDNPVDPDTLPAKVTGMNSDHAPDQSFYLGRMMDDAEQGRISGSVALKFALTKYRQIACRDPDSLSSSIHCEFLPVFYAVLDASHPSLEDMDTFWATNSKEEKLDTILGPLLMAARMGMVGMVFFCYHNYIPAAHQPGMMDLSVMFLRLIATRACDNAVHHQKCPKLERPRDFAKACQPRSTSRHAVANGLPASDSLSRVAKPLLSLTRASQVLPQPRASHSRSAARPSKVERARVLLSHSFTPTTTWTPAPTLLSSYTPTSFQDPSPFSFLPRRSAKAAILRAKCRERHGPIVLQSCGVRHLESESMRAVSIPPRSRSALDEHPAAMRRSIASIGPLLLGYGAGKEAHKAQILRAKSSSHLSKDTFRALQSTSISTTQHPVFVGSHRVDEYSTVLSFPKLRTRVRDGSGAESARSRTHRLVPKGAEARRTLMFPRLRLRRLGRLCLVKLNAETAADRVLDKPSPSQFVV